MGDSHRFRALRVAHAVRLLPGEQELLSATAESLHSWEENWTNLVRSLSRRRLIAEEEINGLSWRVVWKAGLAADIGEAANARDLEQKIKEIEERLDSVGDDAQVTNIDLQAVLDRQQKILQTLSNVLKMQHDTAMAIIRNING